MRLLFTALACLISVSLFGQYSNYYKIDQNVSHSGTVNINENIKVSGHVRQTITTIDYGALAKANAQKEANRLESIRYSNEQDRQAAIAIASDPSKAYDFGQDIYWTPKQDIASNYGFKKFTYYHKAPHKFLFNSIYDGYTYQNISSNNIETIISLLGIYSLEFKGKYKGSVFNNNVKSIGLEETIKFENIHVGDIINIPDMGLHNAYIHKKDINRCTVFGMSGYVSTIIAEDDYEYLIRDYYYSENGDMIGGATVVFKGDKDKVSFEDLEGRRYYFTQLITEIIGSASYSNITNQPRVKMTWDGLKIRGLHY